MVFVMDAGMVPDAAISPEARSLHEVFGALSGSDAPDALFAASGHADLPPELLTEAIASYADTAPPEVAEHLSPVVLGAAPDLDLGLELLASAPQVTWDDVPPEDEAGDVVELLDADADSMTDLPGDPFALDFGTGDEPVASAGTAAEADEPAGDAAAAVPTETPAAQLDDSLVDDSLDDAFSAPLGLGTEESWEDDAWENGWDIGGEG
jgi:hypothetical protein